MQAEQQKIKEVIEQLHECKALFVESVPVKEVFNKLVAWEGVVEVFNLTGHPKATKCFAWSFKDRDTRRYVTVLNLSPVATPQDAVKVAVANEAKKSLA